MLNTEQCLSLYNPTELFQDEYLIYNRSRRTVSTLYHQRASQETFKPLRTPSRSPNPLQVDSSEFTMHHTTNLQVNETTLAIVIRWFADELVAQDLTDIVKDGYNVEKSPHIDSG